MARIKVGYYISDKGEKEFQQILDKKSTKVKRFFTNGNADTSDNDFDKRDMLVLIYEVIDGFAYALFVDRIYRLPYAVAVKVKHLKKLNLKIKDDGIIPSGHRGRASIDNLIKENKNGNS